MKRKGTNPSSDKKFFTKHTGTKGINVRPRPMRGGTRL